MKRLLLLAMLALVMVCWPVIGTSLNFQDYTDYSSITCVKLSGGTGTCTWYNSSAWMNGTLKVLSPNLGDSTYVRLNSPLQTTYAASTLTDGVWGTCIGYNYIRLMDSGGANLYTYSTGCGGTTIGRFEINIAGGNAYVYKNGILVATSPALATNPAYVGFGAYQGGAYWDDIVYGETENKYVVGNPESNAFILKKDFVTPASTGLAFANGTIANSNNMTSTWSKSNITYSGNETLVLQNVDTGDNYGTRYTYLATYGTVSWALADEIFNSGAPYGRYYVTIPGSGAVSEEIWYLGSGATISFDKSDYSGEDTATLTYNIIGGYWDTSTYDYSIDVVSGTTGATLQSNAIAASSGTQAYTFTSTDPLGVYYGIVKATKRSDGSVIWMNYDYAELTSYVTVSGYVNDAETGLPISGANINITQSSIINNLTTIADGNYSATYYLSGILMAINATAPSYRQYEFAFTPAIAKTIEINISLVPASPTTAGLGIGGVARDLAYGRPIKDATVSLINTTNSESYIKTTGFTGWYLCDEGTSCFLTTARPYDIWGEKPGYSNSANYTAVAP